MPQCKEVHPKSPDPNIFLCVREEGHTKPHITYDINSTNYEWEVEK